jgi:hypothetical protein
MVVHTRVSTKRLKEGTIGRFVYLRLAVLILLWAANWSLTKTGR